MKRLLMLSAGMALLATAAWAQDAPAGAPPPPAAPGVTAAQPPAGGPAMAAPMPGAPRPPGPGRLPPPPPPGDAADAGPDGPPPLPPPPGAHFRLQRGDLAVDVGCAADEPMKACADLTIELMDKLQATSKT